MMRYEDWIQKVDSGLRRRQLIKRRLDPFWIFLGALLFLWLTSLAFPQQRQEVGETRFSKYALQQDFMEMRRTLEENHVALDEYTSKKVLDSVMDRSYSLIRDSMALHEFFVLLTPVVAKIGCGHTNVWMPMSYWESGKDRLFPLRFRLIEGIAVVSGSYTKEEQVPRGAVLIEINGRPVDEIVREMKENYPADAMNPYFIEKEIERRFPMIYARRFGFPKEYGVVYALPARKTRVYKTLSPANNNDVRAVVFKNFKTPDLSMRLMEGGKIAVMRIETFIYYDRVPYFRNFIDSCFKVIRERKIENLILDLRGNDGGDPFCAVPLFSYLEPRPLPYFAGRYGRYSQFADPVPRASNPFEGNLVVLIDGRCFSTNGHFCALLKYHHIGTIVGTPSGGTYKCNAGKNTHIDLKNTRIMLYFGRSAFEAAVEGMDKSKPIIPDVLVRETYKGFLDGRDLYIDAALDHFHGLSDRSGGG